MSENWGEYAQLAALPGPHEPSKFTVSYNSLHTHIGKVACHLKAWAVPPSAFRRDFGATLYFSVGREGRRQVGCRKSDFHLLGKKMT